MAEPQTTDKELQDVIASMLKAGKSEDEITSYVQQVDDLQHPFKARIGGAIEAIPSIVTNGIMALPVALKDSIVDTWSVLHGKDPENAKAFVDSLATFMPKLKEAGPREQTRMVTELIGTLGMGAAEGAGIVKKGKAGIRVLGKGMEYVGEHPMATRMAGGAGIMGGIYQGNPEMVAAGVATQAAPPILSNLGKRMIRYGGGETSEMLKSGHMPSSSRDIDTGPVKSLRLGAPASSAPSTDRVPNVGMPATANARVQRVQMDEARSEAAVAARQAKGATNIDDPIINVGKEKMRLSKAPAKVQEAYRNMMGTNVGAEIKAGNPARPAIHVEEPPTTRGRTSDVPPADALHPDKSDLASVLRPGVTPSEMMTPDNPEWFKGSGVRIGRPPVAVQPSADLDKLLAETKVPTDLRVEGEEGINPPPPSAGDALKNEVSIAGDVRTSKGGIRTSRHSYDPRKDSNRTRTTTGTAPLSAETQQMFDKAFTEYMEENPGANAQEVKDTLHETIRKLSGQ